VIVYAPAGEPPRNTGVGEIVVGGGLAPRAGENASASARVAGSGTDSVTLRLWIDERPVSAALAAPGAAAVFALPARQSGTVLGRVEAEPDALRADDRRWFAYTVAPPVPVASDANAPFVGEALAALAAANRITLVPPSGARVIVADAAAGGAAPASIEALVLVAPDSAEQLTAANTALARLGTGLRLAPDEATGAAAIVAAGSTVAPELSGARVTRAYRIRVADGARADTLLRLADGRPWLVRARSRADRPVLLLATPLTPDASTVPASAAMIPLLDRMTGEWAGVADGTTRTLEPGTTVSLPARAAALLAPDDSIHAAEGGAPFQLPARAGVYRALASARPDAPVLAAWSVAAPAVESRLERLDADRVGDALEGDVAVVVGDTDDWRDAIYAARSGAEWWRLLLVLAIIALIAETIIAATRRAPAETS
jgi:hypothetical protein